LNLALLGEDLARSAARDFSRERNAQQHLDDRGVTFGTNGVVEKAIEPEKTPGRFNFWHRWKIGNHELLQFYFGFRE
jgi:hypothetical protein